MSTDDNYSGGPVKSPPSREMFGLRWEYNPHARVFHRFGVSDGCRGVGGHSNPVSAYFALRRWRQVPARPS